MLEIVLFVVVGFTCLTKGVKTYQMEEQNKVFSKYSLRVTDVKGYNQFCGKLMIGFGVAAIITLFFMTLLEGWIKIALVLMVIAEACVIMKIYRNGEKKFMQK